MILLYDFIISAKADSYIYDNTNPYNESTWMNTIKLRNEMLPMGKFLKKHYFVSLLPCLQPPARLVYFH